jgi:hypothetical protein
LGLLLCFLVAPKPAAGQPVAHCVVGVHGSDSAAAGPLKSLSWSCTGVSSKVTVGVDKSLAALKAKAEGVTFSSNCSSQAA